MTAYALISFNLVKPIRVSLAFERERKTNKKMQNSRGFSIFNGMYEHFVYIRKNFPNLFVVQGIWAHSFGFQTKGRLHPVSKMELFEFERCVESAVRGLLS